ncbi:TetR/AcrR family transcriptional regulator [Rathayibacter sp. VKM Ac-2856]|uniref:TetR/AcrR family transcriptional regulator n=1 Tax=unclassified Rathayibacter TaxID=2609250 RepID=UPI001565CE6C|nr:MULTISPECIES: TetR/AcrR family transcriptional regulator [unclassified Rathayibacter]NQX03214.1 TetR/AcrR family transcriptional regulator [Rathayibacter sp. VKM Ac-2858]NQX18382.1 TetR/AcrR family transcriptional regulator [Rathayibacter sp. VKM Ac-2856]
MPSSPSLRQARAQAVLEATMTVLIGQGYATLTVERVAAQAHASKATIYKSWPTKTDLVCAVAAFVDLVPIQDPPVGVDSAEALVGIAAAVRSVTLGDNGRLLLALHEASRVESKIAEAVDEYLVRPQQDAIAAALRTLQGRAIIAADADVALASRVIASLIIDRALVSGEPLSDEELDRIVTQWLVPALTPRVPGGRTLGPTAGPG